MKKYYLLFAGISFMFFTLTSSAQWQATTGPQGAGHISSMTVSGPNILAGTLTGGVFFSADSGATWTHSTGISNPSETKAFTVSSGNVFSGFYSALSDTAVFMSTDNGATWSGRNIAGIFLFSLAAKPGYLLAGTWYGVEYSTNNGTSWNGSSTGLPGNASVSALTFSGTKYFAGVVSSSSGGTGVFSSTNNLSSWSPFNTGWPSPAISSLAVLGSDIFGGVSGGLVYKSPTTAANWAAASTGMTGGNKTLYVLGNNLYSGTTDGIFVTTNNGGNWIDISGGLPVPTTIYSITSDNVYLYAGTDSVVWRRPLTEILTAIDDNDIAQTSVSSYPNPFTSQLNFTSAENESLEVTLYDVASQKLLQKTFSGSVSLSTSQLAKGIYFYEVRNKNGKSRYGKVIKE